MDLSVPRIIGSLVRIQGARRGEWRDDVPDEQPKIGRPSLCTPERTQAIAGLVRGGVFGEVAAQANGVTRTAYYGWMARGRAAIAREAEGVEVPAIEQPYVDFLVAIETADATAEATATLHLMKAMPGAPIALVQYLERRHGRRWSRPDPHGERPGPTAPGAPEAPDASTGTWRANGQLHATSWRAGQGGESDSSAPTVPASKPSVNANRRDIRKVGPTGLEDAPGTAQEARTGPKSPEEH